MYNDARLDDFSAFSRHDANSVLYRLSRLDGEVARQLDWMMDQSIGQLDSDGDEMRRSLSADIMIVIHQSMTRIEMYYGAVPPGAEQVFRDASSLADISCQ
ncbi:hypothetical protein ACWC4D_41520 [Streptomyces sp. NPDC001288]|uniref:hypothetical protein n=1 Tax=unclassified Streptomyces TaxID=2593676 RepID=UPI00332EDDF9